jgi:TctA family transporter
MGSLSLGGLAFFWMLFWIVPLLLVALSRRGNGQERALWALVCVFASWLGFAAFLLSTRKSPEAVRG